MSSEGYILANIEKKGGESGDRPETEKVEPSLETESLKKL